MESWGVMREKPLFITYIIMFLVMIVWGLNVVLVKVLVHEFPTITMTAFRVMLAGLVNMLIVLIARKMKKMTKREWGYILLSTLLGVILHHFFLAKGLVLTEASNTVLILALSPVTTFILAALLLGDRLTKWRFTGIVLAFIGVVFIQGGGSFGFTLGELYVFIAMFVQALSFIYIKKVSDTLDSIQITAFMLLIGSFGLLAVGLTMEPGRTGEMLDGTLFHYFIFLISAVLATAIGHVIFNGAIQRIGAGQAAIFNNFVPFFGLVSAAIFLDEKIYWYQAFGFIFIVLGVLFGSGYVESYWLRSPRRKKQGSN